jgi:hypothetical protein
MASISTASKFSRGKLKTSSCLTEIERERERGRQGEREREGGREGGRGKGGLRRRQKGRAAARGWPRGRHDKGGRRELWLLGNLTAPPGLCAKLKGVVYR